MTHRSRISGPPKSQRPPKSKGGRKPKLHHPPAPPAADDDAPAAPAAPAAPVANPYATPTDAAVLAVLRAAVPCVEDDDFAETVQRIKGLLFARRWLDVFTDPALLPAYVGRWVPSRALCYRDLVAGLGEVREALGLSEGGAGAGEDDGSGASDGGDGGDDGAEDGEAATAVPTPAPSVGTPKRVLSIGGGAGSELLALAAVLRGSADVAPLASTYEWTGIDIGPWGAILDSLASSLGPLGVPLAQSYVQADVLAPPPALPALPPADLTTILFTLTELLAQSKAGTIRCLAALTAAAPPGGLLLVADSASDIAEFALGDGGRTWPVYFVADALLAGRGWDKVAGEDSRWYRLEEGVGRDWPCKLENVRYWWRLYRRV